MMLLSVHSASPYFDQTMCVKHGMGPGHAPSDTVSSSKAASAPLLTDKQNQP